MFLSRQFYAISKGNNLAENGCSGVICFSRGKRLCLEAVLPNGKSVWMEAPGYVMTDMVAPSLCQSPPLHSCTAMFAPTPSARSIPRMGHAMLPTMPRATGISTARPGCNAPNPLTASRRLATLANVHSAVPASLPDPSESSGSQLCSRTAFPPPLIETCPNLL